MPLITAADLTIKTLQQQTKLFNGTVPQLVNNYLSNQSLRYDDINLIPIRTPHTFIDDTQAPDGNMWFAKADNMIPSEVPCGICHKWQYN